MKNQDYFARPVLLSFIVLLILVLNSCAEPLAKITEPTDSPRNTNTQLQIVTAAATSISSIDLSFNQAVGSGADFVNNYSITAPDGSSLTVLAAYPAANGMSVTLATAEQAQVTYVLSANNIQLANQVGASTSLSTQGSNFKGSSQKAPIVASVIALSNTEALITFANRDSGRTERMDEGLENSAFYEIINPNLDILSVTANRDKTTVIVTTSPMDDVAYTIRVTNVKSRSGDRLIDPLLNTGIFNGIAVDDTTTPSITEVVALNREQVQVTFSEALSSSAGDPSRYSIVDGNGNPLIVTGANLNDFATQVVLTTLPQVSSETYTMILSSVSDITGNLLTPNTASFSGSDSVPDSGNNNNSGPPKVTSAGSLDNRSVVITFNEPVQGGMASAENPAHYSITADNLESLSPQSIVTVETAVISTDGTSVLLTTGPQSQIEYTVKVTNVKDLEGNQISPKEPLTGGFNHATFYGKPANGTPLDSDGDDLPDVEELRGWIVKIYSGDTLVREREVTSDPNNADTDGDGLDDFAEKRAKSDPRDSDTDSDNRNDNLEWNESWTSPTNTDSDSDGINDKLEYEVYLTSPLLADTDGDKLNDYEEIFNTSTSLGERRALIANTPKVQFDYVGEAIFRLNVTYSDSTTDVAQNAVSFGSSNVTSSGNSDVSASTASISSTQGWEINGSLSAELGNSTEKGPYVGGKAEISGGYSESTTEAFGTGRTLGFSAGSSQAFSRQLSELNARSENKTETTSTGFIQMGIQLSNTGLVSYRLEDLTITALQRNPEDPSQVRVLAALKPDLSGNGITLAPGASTGALVVRDEDVPATLMRDLFANPAGLYFEIGSFELSDALERNFGFLAETTHNRTAFLRIDYGDGNVEKYQIATTRKRNANGSSAGITMAEVLTDILKIPYDVSVQQVAGPDNVTYTKSALTSLRGLQIVDSANQYRIWTVFGSSDDHIGPNVDFEDIVLYGGQSVALRYHIDDDKDKLPKLEEDFYGSSDTNTDSDDDGRNDFFEVREGWQVTVKENGSVFETYQVYSDPSSKDRDRDGALDNDEYFSRFDPNSHDTDSDGFCDSISYVSPTVLFIGADAELCSLGSDPDSLDRAIFGNVGPTIDNLTAISDNNVLSFRIEASDRNNDLKEFIIDWDDGSQETLLADNVSNDGSYTFNHEYTQPKSYTIKVIAVDDEGLESEAELADINVQFKEVIGATYQVNFTNLDLTEQTGNDCNQIDSGDNNIHLYWTFRANYITLNQVTQDNPVEIKEPTVVIPQSINLTQSTSDGTATSRTFDLNYKDPTSTLVVDIDIFEKNAGKDDHLATFDAPYLAEDLDNMLDSRQYDMYFVPTAYDCTFTFTAEIKRVSLLFAP